MLNIFEFKKDKKRDFLDIGAKYPINSVIDVDGGDNIMGCVCAVQQRARNFTSITSYSSDCTTRLVLSQSQKVLIRKTWPYLEKDMTNIGTQVSATNKLSNLIVTIQEMYYQK